MDKVSDGARWPLRLPALVHHGGAAVTSWPRRPPRVPTASPPTRWPTRSCSFPSSSSLPSSSPRRRTGWRGSGARRPHSPTSSSSSGWSCTRPTRWWRASRRRPPDFVVGNAAIQGGHGRLLLPLLRLLHCAVRRARVLSFHALPVALQVAVRGAAGERVRRRREVRAAGAGRVRGHRGPGAAPGGPRRGVQVAQCRRHGRLHGGLQAAWLRHSQGPLRPRTQQLTSGPCPPILLRNNSPRLLLALQQCPT
jgi:hypothetical protein